MHILYTFRFINSLNRQDLSYKLAVNHMADYSVEDMKVMRGVRKTFDSPRHDITLSLKKDVPVSWDWWSRGKYILRCESALDQDSSLYYTRKFFIILCRLSGHHLHIMPISLYYIGYWDISLCLMSLHILCTMFTTMCICIKNINTSYLFTIPLLLPVQSLPCC